MSAWPDWGSDLMVDEIQRCLLSGTRISRLHTLTYVGLEVSTHMAIADA